MTASPARVVALHRPQSLSGVSVAGARLARCMPDWVPAIIGSGLTRADLANTPFARIEHAQIIAWPEDASPLEQVATVQATLRSMGAQVVVPNDLPHGFLACALDPSLRCTGLFHGDHPRDHDLYERVAPLCHAWRAVSNSITHTVAAHDPRYASNAPAPCPIEVPDAPVPLSNHTTLHLLYAGLLDGNKRPLDLIDLCDALSDRGIDFLLSIAGEGPLQHALADGIAHHVQAGRVRMLGRVGFEQMASLYRACDMLVLTSQSEGSPLVVMEAMATGRPVAISTGSGHAAEIITHNHDGLIFPIGDMQALADALAPIATDRLMLERMGAHAHATAREHFSIGTCAPAFVSLIHEAMTAATLDPRQQFSHWLRTLELLGPMTQGVTAQALAIFAKSHGISPADLPTNRPELLTPRQRIAKAALETLQSTGHHRIALYGAGEHTMHLRAVLDASDAVVAILDDRAGEPGGPPAWIGSRPVFKPDARTLLGIDAVVISSDGYEELLARRAAEWAGQLPVVRLYHPVIRASDPVVHRYGKAG